MLVMALLAMTQQQSVSMRVHVRVEQTCVLSRRDARCSGARAAPPTVVREAGRVIYSF